MRAEFSLSVVEFLSIRSFLFGGNLIALEKKTGGIRPIAIGYVLRRLAAKCANSFATSKLASYFSPLQLGVSVRGGYEAAINVQDDSPTRYNQVCSS